MRRPLDRAGLPHERLRGLRRFHASALIQVGAYPGVVQERPGRADAAFTTQVYGHVAAALAGALDTRR